MRPVRKFLFLLCDFVLFGIDEVTAKIDVEAANGHKVDEELQRGTSHVFVTSCVKVYSHVFVTRVWRQAVLKIESDKEEHSVEKASSGNTTVDYY